MVDQLNANPLKLRRMRLYVSGERSRILPGQANSPFEPIFGPSSIDFGEVVTDPTVIDTLSDGSFLDPVEPTVQRLTVTGPNMSQLNGVALINRAQGDGKLIRPKRIIVYTKSEAIDTEEEYVMVDCTAVTGDAKRLTLTFDSGDPASVSLSQFGRGMGVRIFDPSDPTTYQEAIVESAMQGSTPDDIASIEVRSTDGSDLMAGMDQTIRFYHLSTTVNPFAAIVGRGRQLSASTGDSTPITLEFVAEVSRIGDPVYSTA